MEHGSARLTLTLAATSATAAAIRGPTSGTTLTTFPARAIKSRTPVCAVL